MLDVSERARVIVGAAVLVAALAWPGHAQSPPTASSPTTSTTLSLLGDLLTKLFPDDHGSFLRHAARGSASAARRP